MSRKNLLCLVLLSFLHATNASAEDSEREAVLALMDQAFEAVGSGDPDDLRAIQLAEGTSLSFRSRADGEPGELEMRIATNEALVASGTDDDHEYVERWSGKPKVMIRGPIAVVWGEYEFWIDGEFSHCGIDSVDLVKVDADWKIANWMWTVEKNHCPTGPSRLPDPLEAGWNGAPVCELLHEDSEQRVLRCTFKPGVGHERHFHAPNFGYAVSGGRMQLTEESGVREVDLPTASIFSSDGVVWHEVLNIGDSTVVYLIVEPK